MSRAAQILRWLARILSGAFLLFVAIFVIAYFVGGEEHSARPLTTIDYAAIMTSAALLVGLAVAWKYELAGGAMTLVACLIFAVINWRVFVGFGALIPITALLFLSSWWMRRTLIGTWTTKRAAS